MNCTIFQIAKCNFNKFIITTHLNFFKGKNDAYCAANYWNIPPGIHETAGEGVLIAVLDTGINPDHCIFSQGTIAHSINFVPPEIDIQFVKIFLHLIKTIDVMALLLPV